MRRIEQQGRFRKDLKREARGPSRAILKEILDAVIERLANDLPLDERFRDHALTGNWSDHRDCHLRPDLVLIYRKPDPETLQLVRLGSHAELGW